MPRAIYSGEEASVGVFCVFEIKTLALLARRSRNHVEWSGIPRIRWRRGFRTMPSAGLRESTCPLTRSQEPERASASTGFSIIGI